MGSQPADRPQEAPWTDFCDFRDITHVVLKERHVSVHCQDKCLVGLGAGALWGGGGAPGLRCLPDVPWPAGADPAFPGCSPVLGVAGGWLFPPDS